ncbi:hypothetical protein ACFOWM_06345 [Ferruginibacter yonginensis]|uniref:Phage protein n=1 Tax=Ferruginibacter yonginensis TaxID=1310416 RepID=A0ABV8QS92_9BACT
MNFEFKVNVTRVFQKPYNPKSLKVWIEENTNEVEGVQHKKVETETVEELENGTRKENRTFNLPVMLLQQLIDGYDFVTGKPIINVAAFNQFLIEYDLEIDTTPALTELNHESNKK